MSEQAVTVKSLNDHFKAIYIIYIILALVSIVLTGMVLAGGYASKGILWTLFVLNIFLYGAAIYFMLKGHKLWSSIAVILPFVLNIIILIATNNAGNVSNCDINGRHASSGIFASASVFSVLALLAGIFTIYNKSE